MADILSSNILLNILMLSVTVVVCYIIYIWKWRFTYWKRKGLQYLEPKFPFGNTNLMTLKRVGYAQQFSNIYNEFRSRGLRHGGAFIFSSPFYMPIDPDIIKEIFQNSFLHFTDRGLYVDEENDPLSGHLFLLNYNKWKKLRNKLTPTFTSGKMKMMFQTFLDCTKGLIEILDTNPEAVDIKDVMGRFTTDIIGSCAFGIKCNSMRDPENDFRFYGKRAFERDQTQKIKQILINLLPRSFLHIIGFKMTNPEVEKFFTNIVKDTVEYRERYNINRKDFMHLLIQLKNRGTISDDGKLMDDGGKEGNVDFSLSELTGVAFGFFLAGFETSSTTMTFALFEIAKNPDVQEKLRKEIEMVLTTYDNRMTYESIMEMSYMEQVLNETMRKYPPVPVLFRECTKAFKVPGSDVTIDAGIRVVIPLLGIQNDLEHYPDPDQFDPDRFTKEKISTRHPFTYLPFGEGPRICLGLRFGMMQAKIGIATLLKHYQIKLNPKTNLPMKLSQTSLVTAADGGIWLDFDKIKE